MKKIISIFLTALMLMAGGATCLSAVPDDSAKSCLLMTLDGEIIYAHDENVRRGMASTTKIMTALVALENCPAERLVSVAPAAVNVEGSSVYLYAGEKITMENLLFALMLQSANDAAAAIAIEVAGSIEAFAEMMNRRAEEMGLHDTHFANPHGLDNSEHYTTAKELAIIAAEALKNPRFAEIVSTAKKAIPLHDGTATRLLVNHNRLLRTYDDVIGVKTGFTKKCGRTLVSAAQRDGVTLICVTLCDGSDWHDHRELLDYGFSLYESEKIASAEEFRVEIPVCGGEKENVRCGISEDVLATLKKGHGEIKTVLKTPRFLYAGICEGEKTGEVEFICGGKVIARADIVARESIAKTAVKKRRFLF